MTLDQAMDPGAVRIPLAPIRQRRVRLINALVSHGPAAILLLRTGISLLRGTPFPSGAELALAVIATLAGAWQAMVLIGEIRESGHLEIAAQRLRKTDLVPTGAPASTGAAHSPGHHGETDAILHVPSLALALVYAAECWLHWHETGHVTRPYVLGAVMFALIGFGGMRFIQRRRAAASALTIDQEGIAMRRPRQGRQFITWGSVGAIEYSPTSIRVMHTNGSALHLDAAEYDHGYEVLQQVKSAIAKFRDISSEAQADAPPGLTDPEAPLRPAASVPDPV